jgi:hypothetical protein
VKIFSFPERLRDDDLAFGAQLGVHK